MRIDPRVSELKFEQEVERLSAQIETLKKRGVIIHRIEYPVVEAIFLPTAPLKLMQIFAEMPQDTPLPPGITLPPDVPPEMKLQFQIQHDLVIGTRVFGVRIAMDDFDQRAPSVVFCDPITWEGLPDGMIHIGNHVDQNGIMSHVTIAAHPVFKRPFLCMRGIREYHEHPQHSGDDWMQYRQDYGLFSTLDTVWKTCIHNARPFLVVASKGTPHNLQFGWANLGAK
jgi:putative metal binding uncharacterized protein